MSVFILLAHAERQIVIPPWFPAAAFGLFGVFFLFFFGRIVLRSRKAIRLLEEGRGEEFLELIDEDLARMKSQGYQRFLKINKSAGLAFLGRFGEGVSLLDEVDISKLRGKVRILYINNMLYNLARSDPGRAREFYQTHRERFESPSKDKMLRHALRGTRATYRLLVEGDEGVEGEFRELAEDEGIPAFARAQNQFCLALIAARQGRIPEAKERYERARKCSPMCYLGEIPGVATVG